MDIFLQIWGGTGYLLAKIFLSHAEGLEKDRPWRMAGWLMYILGLPAWVILLIARQNWIAAANEGGGAPALILGLIIAWKNLDTVPKYVDWGIKLFTYGIILAGTVYSLRVFNGITTVSQILEIGVTVGFLLGTYFLAKKKTLGWIFMILMLISMGSLMYIHGKILLIIQQIVSLFFAVNGFLKSVHKIKPNGRGNQI
jgi:hypothetical protein